MTVEQSMIEPNSRFGYEESNVVSTTDDKMAATTTGLSMFYCSGMLTPTCIEEALVANSCITVVPGPSTSCVIEINIGPKRITCIRDNGVVDMLKFGYSESAKTALLSYAKLQSTIARRGNTSINQQTSTATVSSNSTIGTEKPSVQQDIISFDAFDDGRTLPSPPTVNTNLETPGSMPFNGVAGKFRW